MKRPHILLILTDQQMAGTLGCYGSRHCRTPHIDRLANEGIRFTNAYTACPVCSPARASIHTGLYPFKHGMQSNIYTRGCMIHELVDQPRLLSRRLASAGYRTGITGKWHLGFGKSPAANREFMNHVKNCPMLGEANFSGCLPSDIGFAGDDFPGHGGDGSQTKQYRDWLIEKGIDLRTRTIVDHYPETYEVLSGSESTVSWFLADRAMEHMAKLADTGEPFFYMLNFWGPHSPYHASSKYVELYRDMEIAPWPSFGDASEKKPRIHEAHRTEHLRRWKWAQFEQVLRYYYAAVSEIDAQVGRLTEWLHTNNLLDETVIIFASDHGDSIGIHRGLTDKSLFMYEETIRIPLVIRDPSQKSRSGHTDDRFAGTCDLYSTILDYSGLDRKDTQLDGRSLKPVAEGETCDWRDCMVTEASGIDFLLHTQRALRYGNYKYVFNCGDLDELYDLQADPHELHNLAVEPACENLLQELRLRLDRWMLENGDGTRERFRRICGLC